ncbi:MAG: efflux RND transporter periplasmic adaptor subunit [Acetobacteraceae bacterium]|nr:efflux RND transporter periplasmic adaptor subunit [Acetobacteraceae bacterium]
MRLSQKSFVWAAGAVALGTAGFVLLNSFSRGPAGPSAPVALPMPVPVIAVDQRTVPVYLDFVGTTEAIRSVTLQARVTGYLATQPVGDGADVQKDQLLYQVDPRDYLAALDQATAQARRDAAAHEYSRVSYGRNETLTKQGWVSRDTFDQSTSAFRQSEATLAADAAAIQAARLNLGYTEIRAPFGGRLGRSLVHEGALISVAGTQLNTLVQLDPIYVTFNPSETDLTLLGDFWSGKTIRAEVTIPGNGGKRYEGALTFLNNTVDRNTGTIIARATIFNPDHSLLPGEFVHVRLHVADHPNTLLVPQVALGSSQLGKYLYVADKDKAVQRLVSIGPTYGDLVVITKGVAAREAVIVGNLQKIAPGAPVQPMPEQPPRFGATPEGTNPG